MHNNDDLKKKRARILVKAKLFSPFDPYVESNKKLTRKDGWKHFVFLCLLLILLPSLIFS